MDSFHHYPNPKKALREIYRVLKPKGAFILCDYWEHFPKRQLMNLFISFSKDGDVKIYSKEEIVNLLKESKFRNIEWEKVNKNSYIARSIKEV